MKGIKEGMLMFVVVVSVGLMKGLGDSQRGAKEENEDAYDRCQ